MAFYDEGAKEGGFEVGIRTALEAMLASPHFVFRFEATPARAKPGDALSRSATSTSRRGSRSSSGARRLTSR